MKRKGHVLLAAVCLVLCSGCFWLRREVRREMVDFYNQEVLQQVRKEMIDYYENLANAYKLLGFGYYHLYKESLARGDKEAAEQYRMHAGMYKTYADDLEASAKAWRASIGMYQPVSPAAAPSAEARETTAPMPRAPSQPQEPPAAVKPAETPRPSAPPKETTPTSSTKVEDIAPKPTSPPPSVELAPEAPDSLFPLVETQERRPSLWQRLRSRFRRER